jgi:putative addiction module CopG family antidote
MNVSLTAELEAFVEGAVKSGRYGSASEAVRHDTAGNARRKLVQVIT